LYCTIHTHRLGTRTFDPGLENENSRPSCLNLFLVYSYANQEEEENKIPMIHAHDIFVKYVRYNLIS